MAAPIQSSASSGTVPKAVLSTGTYTTRAWRTSASATAPTSRRFESGRWKADARDDRALKAMNLVLQAGGFGLVAFDLSDVRGPALRQFPHTTWMRIARIVEGSLTVTVLLGTEHIARSPGGATVVLEQGGARASAEWAGDNARNRRLQGLAIRPRVISMRTLGVAASGTRALRTTAG